MKSKFYTFFFSYFLNFINHFLIKFLSLLFHISTGGMLAPFVPSKPVDLQEWAKFVKSKLIQEECKPQE